MQTHEDNNSKATRWVLGFILLIIILAGGFLIYRHQTSYTRFVTATNATELQNQITEGKPNQLTVVMNYRTGCKHCEEVHNKIIKQIETTAKNKHINFVMSDSQYASVRNYFASHNVLFTPTVAVLYNGAVIQQYTGTNANKLNHLLAGNDMNHNAPISKKTPINSLVVNDELGTNKVIPISSHHNLNYNLK